MLYYTLGLQEHPGCIWDSKIYQVRRHADLKSYTLNIISVPGVGSVGNVGVRCRSPDTQGGGNLKLIMPLPLDA